MIYIPEISEGKALVAVEGKCLDGCIFYNKDRDGPSRNCYSMECDTSERKDGKNVIFNLVDLPPDGLTRTLDLMQFSRKELGEEL